MITIPLQTFGIGDVIFCQTLVNSFGSKVLWPVEQQFAVGLNRAYPDTTFVDWRLINVDYNYKKEIKTPSAHILPIRFADSIMQVAYKNCMRAKYDMYGMDWEDWRNDAMWQRDEDVEIALCKKLELPPRYNLINRFFGSQSQLVAPIKVDNGLPNIEMCSIEGFSIFDWAKVIENAYTIHTVSTSIIYLLEMLSLNASEIHLYIREPIEHSHVNYDYILQRHNYILK